MLTVNVAMVGAGSGDTERLVSVILLQLVIILLAARAAGKVAHWLGQPRVVGEIIGGIVIGKSVFGRLFPDTFQAVFMSVHAEPVSVLSQIGLILLMFQIGLAFDFSHLREARNRNTVISAAVAGIALPFGLGLLLGHWSAPTLAPGVNPLAYQLFLAVALSITAIPILGRIMMEFGLTRTHIGAVAISAAAINDVIGWTLLAVISALTTSAFSLAAFGWQLVAMVVYGLVCWLVVRPLLKRLLRNWRVGGAGQLPHWLLAILLAVIFLSGLATYKLGIFAIFGGFAMGVLLYDEPEFVAAWNRTIADFVTVFFLPIFFTFTGLRTNVTALDTLPLWGWCVALTAAAIVGKYLGCAVAGRITGLSWVEAGCLGVLMNTRALMELVVINIGYDLGVIPQNVFAMLVLMAITTTVMTSPILRRYLVKMKHTIPASGDF